MRTRSRSLRVPIPPRGPIPSGRAPSPRSARSDCPRLLLGPAPQRPESSDSRGPGPSAASATLAPGAGWYVKMAAKAAPAKPAGAAKPAWAARLDQEHFDLQAERVQAGLPAVPVCTILGTQDMVARVMLCAHFNAGVPCPEGCPGGESHRCNLAIPAGSGATKSGARKMRACGGPHARWATHETWGGNLLPERRVREMSVHKCFPDAEKS